MAEVVFEGTSVVVVEVVVAEVVEFILTVLLELTLAIVTEVIVSVELAEEGSEDLPGSEITEAEVADVI